VFLVYAVFLGVTGWLGAYLHDYSAKAMHSMYAGAGGGAVMAVCGLLSLLGSAEKGKPGYTLFMIVVHVGLLFVGLFAAVFGIQLAKNLANDQGDGRAALFGALEAGTLLALFALVRTKPKKSKKGASAD